MTYVLKLKDRHNGNILSIWMATSSISTSASFLDWRRGISTSKNLHLSSQLSTWTLSGEEDLSFTLNSGSYFTKV